MTHDITHCNGTMQKDICPKRDDCYRYLAYLDALKKNIQYIYMLIPTKLPCDLFWENEKIVKPRKKQLKQLKTIKNEKD